MADDSAAVVQAREVERATGLAPPTVPELILSGPSREMERWWLPMGVDAE
jgi:hypothetical protein